MKAWGTWATHLEARLRGTRARNNAWGVGGALGLGMVDTSLQDVVEAHPEECIAILSHDAVNAALAGDMRLARLYQDHISELIAHLDTSQSVPF